MHKIVFLLFLSFIISIIASSVFLASNNCNNLKMSKKNPLDAFFASRGNLYFQEERWLRYYSRLEKYLMVRTI